MLQQILVLHTWLREMPLPFPITKLQPHPSKHPDVESVQTGAFFSVSCALTEYPTRTKSTEGGSFSLQFEGTHAITAGKVRQQEQVAIWPQCICRQESWQDMRLDYKTTSPRARERAQWLEHALLQRTCIQFLTSSSCGSQPPVTPAPLSRLNRHLQRYTYPYKSLI